MAVALVRVILAQHQRASPEAKDIHPDHDEERRSEAIETPAIDVSPEARLQTVAVGLVPDRTVLIPRFPPDDVGDRPDRAPVEALTPPPGVGVGVDVRTRHVEQRHELLPDQTTEPIEGQRERGMPSGRVGVGIKGLAVSGDAAPFAKRPISSSFPRRSVVAAVVVVVVARSEAEGVDVVSERGKELLVTSDGRGVVALAVVSSSQPKSMG